MCCASSEEHMMQRFHIDARNDESTGKYKDVGTIEDYKPTSLKKKKRTLEFPMMDIRKNLWLVRRYPRAFVMTVYCPNNRGLQAFCLKSI